MDEARKTPYLIKLCGRESRRNHSEIRDPRDQRFGLVGLQVPDESPLDLIRKLWADSC